MDETQYATALKKLFGVTPENAVWSSFKSDKRKRKNRPGVELASNNISCALNSLRVSVVGISLEMENEIPLLGGISQHSYAWDEITDEVALSQGSGWVFTGTNIVRCDFFDIYYEDKTDSVLMYAIIALFTSLAADFIGAYPPSLSDKVDSKILHLLGFSDFFSEGYPDVEGKSKEILSQIIKEDGKITGP